MIKLKRYRQRVSEPFLAVFAPDNKQVVKNPAIHAYRTVNFVSTIADVPKTIQFVYKSRSWQVRATWAGERSTRPIDFLEEIR